MKEEGRRKKEVKSEMLYSFQERARGPFHKA
jgi:hypothetical protein